MFHLLYDKSCNIYITGIDSILLLLKIGSIFVLKIGLIIYNFVELSDLFGQQIGLWFLARPSLVSIILFAPGKISIVFSGARWITPLLFNPAFFRGRAVGIRLASLHFLTSLKAFRTRKAVKCLVV